MSPPPPALPRTMVPPSETRSVVAAEPLVRDPERSMSLAVIDSALLVIDRV